MADVLIFDRSRRQAQTVGNAQAELQDAESLLYRLESDHKAIRARIRATRNRIRELKAAMDSTIGKIAVRQTSRGPERVRIYDIGIGGYGYYAVKVKADGSESSARNREKHIVLNDYQGWELEHPRNPIGHPDGNETI